MAEASLSRAARLATHLADPVRLAVLDLLAGHGPMTVSELAARLGRGMPALSNHLAKLRRDGLAITHREGRQTYYALANPELGELLDALRRSAGSGDASPSPRDATLAQLREARTCYDHLAGRVGVGLFDVLLAHEVIANANDRPGSLREGPAASWLYNRFELDAATLRMSRRRFAFGCLDWTEHRFHVGGALGEAISSRFFELTWVETIPGSRAVRVTPRGEAGLSEIALELSRR